MKPNLAFAVMAILVGALPVASAADADTERRRFLELINEYRAQNGAPALEINSKLEAAAQWMSADMAAKNYFSHTDSLGRDAFKRMTDFGYDASTAKGENIAAGYATAEAVIAGWKNSAGHNANMLNAGYRVIGIGLAAGASGGYAWYWTTDFGGRQTDPPALNCDLDGSGTVDVRDVQLMVNEALALRTCAHDLDRDGRCTVTDVQRVVNAALGGACVTN